MVFFKDGQEIRPDGHHYFIDHLNDGTIRLTVHVVTDEDEADYMVLAENIAGHDKCLFELFVDTPGWLPFFNLLFNT